MKNRIYFIPAIALALFVSMTPTAWANPLRFPPAVPSATATTTATFFTTSTATTTLATYDTYSNTGVTGGGGSTQAMDRATLLIQLAASSTSSVLYTTVEHSQDGIDWYQDNLFTPTSAAYNSITNPNVYVWTAAGTATSSKAINIPTPLRFVRAKFWMSGAAGAVWTAIQPQKQSS
jgi:hypothetical protein